MGGITGYTQQQLEGLLKQSYQEATRKGGLRDFTQEVRGPKNDLSGKYSVTSKRLDHLFNKVLWEASPSAGGHRKLTHRISRVVVEYADHGNSGGIDPGAAENILNQVQAHLNYLGNEVFCYKGHNWKTFPDYKKAAERLTPEKKA